MNFFLGTLRLTFTQRSIILSLPIQKLEVFKLFCNKAKYHFDDYYKCNAVITCKEWDYPPPTEEFFSDALTRIPFEIRDTITTGLLEGIIVNLGLRDGTLKVKLINQTKERYYSWFGRYRSKKILQGHWEFCIQAAEYIQLYKSLKDNNYYDLQFEDALMDIAIYRNNGLFACCEVKEKAAEVNNMIKNILKCEAINLHDLGGKLINNIAGIKEDAVRKAGYIIKNRPNYFYLLSAHNRLEYRVEYPDGQNFKLIEDVIPFPKSH